ncbi:hypothetical protein [Metabacillus sp. SLBN-84]
MNTQSEKFYDVIMTVEVRRTVLATSESEARDKADTSDMIHEIKNYRLDETITVEEIKDRFPTEYDRIDDIGAQIVADSYAPMHVLKAKYGEIRNLNQALAKAGKPEYEPHILNRMTDDFLTRLK